MSFSARCSMGSKGFAFEKTLAAFLPGEPLARLQLVRRSRCVSLTKPKGSNCIAAIPPAQYILLNCALESLTRSNHDRR